MADPKRVAYFVRNGRYVIDRAGNRLTCGALVDDEHIIRKNRGNLRKGYADGGLITSPEPIPPTVVELETLPFEDNDEDF